MDLLGERELAQIAESEIFFVATAPLDAAGHVNLSPKGLRDTFAVLTANRVAYADLTGSGAETAAHVGENGRITLMWCSFGEQPNVLRLYGRAQAHHKSSERFGQLRGLFGEHLGVRGIIEVEVEKVKNSCGFGVPVAGALQARGDLDAWSHKKGEEGLAGYQERKNQRSIDGLAAWRQDGLVPQE